MADFIVSMVLTAVNDITPVLTEINAQLDTLKANMATLTGAAAAVDTTAMESMAPAIAETAKQADVAAASITGMGTATASVDTSAVEAMAPAIASASTEAKNLERGMGGAGQAAKNTATQVASTKKGLKALSHLGIGLTAAGAVLGYGIVKGLDMAGELQSTLVTVQDTTGATTKQMQSLNDTILTTSANVSRFTDLDVAGFAQQLASGGLPGGMKSVQSLLMPMTQFADAQMYEGKVGSGSDAVNMAINMAHLLGHYDPASLLKSLNTFNQYSVMEPGSSDDLYQTLKYLAPSARMLHLNESSTMEMAALANRVGLNGTHGGTNAADMILRLIPGYVMGMGGKPSPSVANAMKELGMVNSKGQSQFFNSKGQLVNFPQMIQTLVNDGKKFNPEQLTTLFGHVFGVQGGRAATLFANPQMLEQLQGMVNQLKHTKSIAQIQKDQQNTPQGQLNELKSNSTTAMIRIATQLGTAFNPFLHSLNAVLGVMLKFEAQHPKFLKFVAVFTSIAAATLLTVGPMLMLVGGVGKLALFFKGQEFLKGLQIIKQITGATKIWAAIQWVLNAALDANPIGITIVAVAALIAVIAVLVANWKRVVKWVQEAARWFSNLSPAAKIVVTSIMPIVGIPLLIISNWKPISAFFAGIFKTIISWIESAWKWYQNLGDKVKWLIAAFAPFIGIPLLIISKWQPLVAFFTNLWTNVLQPIINGIGKLTGGVISSVEHFLHIGNWQNSTPSAIGGGSGGNTQVTNHFYISSTNPKQAASEVANTQDKYYRSRYPLAATR